MLTILCSSNTGMQARQMLERKPPTWASILSSTTSFSVLRRPTSGLDSSSATIELDRPAVDAARLVDAVDRHLHADQRGLAAGGARRPTAAAACRSCRAWPGRRPPATAPAPAWWRRARRRSPRRIRAAAARDLAAVPEVLRPLLLFPVLRHGLSSLVPCRSLPRSDWHCQDAACVLLAGTIAQENPSQQAALAPHNRTTQGCDGVPRRTAIPPYPASATFARPG